MIEKWHLVIIKVKELKVNFVFEALGQLLSVLVVLDEIVKHHPTLKDHWSSYMKAIQVAHHNPNKFSAEVDKLKPLESALARLDSQILSGYILQNCVEQPFDTSSAVQVTTNAVLNDKMLKAIRELFARWDKRCASDVPDKQGLMSIITLIVLHHYIYRTIDKKLIRTIWESYRR
uniref:WASH complex subunit 4 N-terminal domain-containing protein n=1 Tax=Plectus sambesii TaxID=2011161 RepID=A0A914V3K7_9BILA